MTPHPLHQRRRRLRSRRQRKRVGSLWRLLIVGSAAAASLWFFSHPNWVVRSPEDINIQGNQWLPDPLVHQHLAISYPETLLQLNPQAIATRLEANLPITEAHVNRQLLPPRLIVHVQERAPVAVALLPPQTDANGVIQEQIGLLDTQGLWVPLDSQDLFTQLPHLPSLRVRGSRQIYESSWPRVYAALEASPLQVTEIDWRDPSRVILHSRELGEVHLGSLGENFEAQLAALDRLRNLPQEIDLNDVDYIDLQNPEAPYVQTRSPSPSPSASGD
ncbi:MAG: cell division protein FtsQ/DivIB [Cyanobacteriota bacterium]|nr:MAG: FtsQ-type POTRA domain-containing protein [Phormidium sp. SL48-SHIP]